MFSWQDEKYVLADGMFTEVVKRKGNAYHVRKINSDKVFYLVTNGSVYAHGDTLAQAKDALKFKIDSEKYKHDPILPDTVITTLYYRIVTGACEFGVREWMARVFTDKQRSRIEKNGIKAKLLMPMLKKHNAYGVERFAKLYTEAQ